MFSLDCGWLREVNAEMYEDLDANQNGRSAKRKGKGKCFDDEESYRDYF